jgi:hypothetical protein
METTMRSGMAIRRGVKGFIVEVVLVEREGVKRARSDMVTAERPQGPRTAWDMVDVVVVVGLLGCGEVGRMERVVEQVCFGGSKLWY